MSQLHSLAGLVQLQRLPYNTVVVEQGSKADATYFIKVGEVRVVKRVECSMPFYRQLQKDALQAAKYAPSSQTKHRCCNPCSLWYHQSYKLIAQSMLHPFVKALITIQTSTLSSVIIPSWSTWYGRVRAQIRCQARNGLSYMLHTLVSSARPLHPHVH